ncbi:hypothetical protein [Variovorax sp. RA8]|uniref:hypothetical protein n=1 Tax=Variovorax sp. (strain JCM 16519 / RA8) TaxID=662548 RepID=UPI001318167E|nr:hypothetical protein [Variovorax sp. RA8]VTU34127.1 hypothetical protein RA8CHR_04910 [Variovorax sp. RA8]
MADLSGWGAGTDNPYLGTSNPYLQQMIDAASGDVVRNFNLSARPASNATMVRSGSFGNSGLEEMARNDEKNLQGSLSDIATKLRFGDYTQQQDMYRWQKGFGEGQRQFDEGTRRYEQDFDRGVFNDAYAQNMGNLQAGIGLLGTLGGYNALDQQNAGFEQTAPLNYLQQFSQIASGLGGMGGTSTGTQGTSSNPLLSAVGGAQLGNSWWRQGGGSSGGGSSGGWDWGNTASDGTSTNGSYPGWRA